MFSLSYKLSSNKVEWKIETENISPAYIVILHNSKCDPFNTWKNNSEKVKNWHLPPELFQKTIQDTKLLVRDLMKYPEHSFISPLLYSFCHGKCICWSLSDHLRIVLLFEILHFYVLNSTVRTLVLKQQWQGADKALVTQFPGCQELSWALSGPCTQSPTSAMNPENLLCSFRVCWPFTGRVLLSHLGNHLHRLPLPDWKISKFFGSGFKRLSGNNLTLHSPHNFCLCWVILCRRINFAHSSKQLWLPYWKKRYFFDFKAVPVFTKISLYSYSMLSSFILD